MYFPNVRLTMKHTLVRVSLKALPCTVRNFIKGQAIKGLLLYPRLLSTVPWILNIMGYIPLLNFVVWYLYYVLKIPECNIFVSMSNLTTTLSMFENKLNLWYIEFLFRFEYNRIQFPSFLPVFKVGYSNTELQNS